MDAHTAVGIAEGFIPASDRDEVIKAWQYLHDSRLAYQLQGWFGRTAIALLESGEIVDHNPKGE